MNSPAVYNLHTNECGDIISGMDSVWVPLAQRSSRELQSKADELRLMAGTARTHDVAVALLTLADRYEALAEKRRAQGD